MAENKEETQDLTSGSNPEDNEDSGNANHEVPPEESSADLAADTQSDTEGTVAYAEVNPDYTRRPEPSDLFPVLDQLAHVAAA